MQSISTNDMMSVEEFEAWHKLPFSCWSISDARRADKLIKTMTLNNVKAYLEMTSLPKNLVDYILIMVDEYFGCVETDEMIMSLGLYPAFVDYKNVKEESNDEYK